MMVRRSPPSMQGIDLGSNQKKEKSGLLLSLIFHAIVLSALFVGSALFPEKELPPAAPIPIEIIQISEISSAPPPTKTQEDTRPPAPAAPVIEETPPLPPPPEPEPPKEEPKPELVPEPEPIKEEIPLPPAPEPVKEELPPPPPEPEPTPAPEPKKEEPLPEPVPVPEPEPKKEEPQPEPIPEVKPEPKKEIEKPKKEDKPKKEEKKKEEKPKKEKKKKEEDAFKKVEEAVEKEIKKAKKEVKKAEDAFDSVLKAVEDLSKKPDAPQPKNGELSDKRQPNEAATLSDVLSASEIDAIRRQLAGCWSPPTGGTEAAELVVGLHISVKPTGEVKEVEILDKARYNSNPQFRAAADAARRAVWHEDCRVLKIPSHKYEQLKSFNLRFNPKDIF